MGARSHLRLKAAIGLHRTHGIAIQQNFRSSRSALQLQRGRVRNRLEMEFQLRFRSLGDRDRLLRRRLKAVLRNPNRVLRDWQIRNSQLSSLRHAAICFVVDKDADVVFPSGYDEYARIGRRLGEDERCYRRRGPALDQERAFTLAVVQDKLMCSRRQTIEFESGRSEILRRLLVETDFSWNAGAGELGAAARLIDQGQLQSLGFHWSGQ